MVGGGWWWVVSGRDSGGGGWWVQIFIMDAKIFTMDP